DKLPVAPEVAVALIKFEFELETVFLLKLLDNEKLSNKYVENVLSFVLMERYASRCHSVVVFFCVNLSKGIRSAVINFSTKLSISIPESSPPILKPVIQITSYC